MQTEAHGAEARTTDAMAIHITCVIQLGPCHLARSIQTDELTGRQ